MINLTICETRVKLNVTCTAAASEAFNTFKLFFSPHDDNVHVFIHVHTFELL